MNWKHVIEALGNTPGYSRALDKAVALCELAAKLPPGEAERVLEFAIRRQAIRADIDTELQAKREPERACCCSLNANCPTGCLP